MVRLILFETVMVRLFKQIGKQWLIVTILKRFRTNKEVERVAPGFRVVVLVHDPLVVDLVCVVEGATQKSFKIV